ncbi:MAG: sugar phosphate isomerase/epimerase [Bacteroidota bacterium]
MKQRREFLKKMGVLTAVSMLPSYLASAAPKKIKEIGVQLYTFRKGMESGDPKGTLKLISELGINQIESASSRFGLFYGLTAKEMKQTCKDLGMTLRSGHCNISTNWESTVEQAAESGQEYLISSGMPIKGQTVDTYKRAAEMFNKAGEDCKKAGIKFGYHNHASEFQSEGGQVFYDVLLQNTDPKYVGFEMDLGWVVAGGKDPFKYFEDYKGRFPLWHLKDMKGTRSTEFGTGDLDITRLLKARKEAGLKYFFIEQEEYTESPLASMKINMAYLQNLNL